VSAPDAYPITDPETGEVLALDEADRREVVAHTAAELVDAQRRLDRVRAEVEQRAGLLAQLMVPGDAVALAGGWAVTCKPGAPAKRAVNVQAVKQHAEGLAPLGLAPVQVTSEKLPTVAAFTTTKARTALARLGLTPETFLVAGEVGKPQVVVIQPDPQETP
jgi:hypothetical protein